MRTPIRWTLAMLAVVGVLIATLLMSMRHTAQVPGAEPAAGREHRDADSPAALVEPRRRAHLPPCPAGLGGPGPAALRGVEVECASDGTRVDVAGALAGRRVVLNLWAYWCGPCRDELPALADYQRRAGPAVTVLTVHQDENETAALLRLAELGVALPTLQDGQRRIAAALGVPNVMPTTVVLAADGTVAHVLPRAFASAEEIAAAVESPS